MINRRGALAAMAAATFGAVPASAAVAKILQSDPAQTQGAPSGNPPKDAIQDAVQDRLRQDVARLAPRAYSEEGVPVFLACEDLAADKALRGPKVPVTPFNTSVASDFGKTAEAWQRIHPDAPDTDISKVIEVLADRDFSNGGVAQTAAAPLSAFAQRAAAIEQTFATHPLIRAVNFHNTSRAQVEQYERQLAQYSLSFSSVNQEELEEYLTTGKWNKPKPGLIVSVFEGYRNSFDVLTPLIEKYGFIGWYWVITGFINASIPNQRTFAENHDIDMLTHEYADGRYALTWDELRQLDKKHVIACHTRSHTLLAQLDPDIRRQEVVGSQEDFKKNLGHPVRAFVSLTGPAYGENPATDSLIDAAGYDFVFSNFLIQRIRAKSGSPSK